jgi:hypothetical protein
MNPRSVRKKVASSTISGFSEEHKFHFSDIPEKWFKVDVHKTHCPNATLIFQNEDAEQTKVKDVLKGNTIWDDRYMKNTI